MKARNLIILGAVVVALGAYIYFVERHQSTTEEITKEAQLVFPGLESEQVRRVELTTPSGHLVLERGDDDSWRLEEPIAAAADGAAVESLLGSVITLEADRRLNADEVDPGAYGLEDPEIQVMLEDDDGASHLLKVGHETPLGSKRAVATGAPGVILCSGWFAKDLEHPLEHWRSKDVVELYPADVASLELRIGDEEVRVAHIGERWQLLEPVDDLADPEHMRQLVSDLNGMRAESFIDSAEAVTESGLDEPELELTILRTEGREPLRLDFGSRRTEEGVVQVACRIDGRDAYWVKDPARIRLEKAPMRWRSPTVHPFETWDAERLEIRNGAQDVVLNRDQGAWQSADGRLADPTAVQDRLRALADLEARSYDLILPEVDPVAEIQVGLGGDGEKPLDYRFYAPLSEGGRPLVQVSGRATVMSVDNDDFSALVNDLDSLLQPEEEAADTEVDTE